jgi:hypothetical protein
MWKRMTLWPHRRERARGRVATGKMEAGLRGATEMVGQQFVALLEHDRWFQLTWMFSRATTANRCGRMYKPNACSRKGS